MKSKIVAPFLIMVIAGAACGQVMKTKTEQPGDRSARLLSLDTAVHTGRLPNGFTYYIRHNEEPKHRVVMYLVNKVGSVLEDEDQRGLAHFMEHMSFNGTKHFPHNELVNYLQKAGVRFGADLNAYTGFDETVYELPIPSDKPDVRMDALKEALQIRVLERLREDESGVYSPKVTFTGIKVPKATFNFSISFGCAPENVNKLIASALDEVQKIKTEGPPQVNVDKWKAEFLNTVGTQIKTNAFWLGYLQQYLINYHELLPVGDYAGRADKVTVQDVRQLANQYLSGQTYIQLVLMPESSK